MKFSKNFFVDSLGFDFEYNLKSKENFFLANAELQNKLKGKIFYYDNQPNKTSFYLITIPLQLNEFETIRRYFWNENKANLFFYIKYCNNTLELYDAKASPKVDLNQCRLDIFKTTQEDLDKIEQIKRWKFDNGTFWENYYSFLQRIKYKRIDKALVDVLKILKEQLNNSLSDIEDINKRKETVQALIDRTLYIKYLEDNHIVNSYFYNHYFDDKDFDYKALLKNKDKKGLNILFQKIHEIFNNGLFDRPTIELEYLSTEVCDLIYMSFTSDLKTKQLRLFDFQFDIIPVEFISYIYEVFLTDKQKKNGIYYTPKKLAQLIIDDVIPIDRIGKVLDPSCGSGMFLIVAFQKLLENSNEKGLTDIEKIEFRTKLLAENIFGIEKEKIAQRFTLFSLSLQIFRGLNASKIKQFIANQLANDKIINLFNKYSFFDNIKCANSLSTKEDDVIFEDKTFDYIVGNPPFFEIKETHKTELDFIKNYQTTIDNIKVSAHKLVGTHQISQCFLLRIKDWSNPNTRFGFVSNSSNFYNDKSKTFQNFFYKSYNIEKIYELSRVKKMLFENAKESVITLIFSNQVLDNNIIKYYPVEMGFFSDKPFELLIIQEDKRLDIQQLDLLTNNIALRDYLVGNEFDRLLIKMLANNTNLEKFLSKNENYSSVKGLDRITNKNLLNYYKIKGKVSRERYNLLHEKYAQEKYLNQKFTNYFNTPYIHKPEGKLCPFILVKYDGYVNKKDINRDNFQRIRNPYIYKGSKILTVKFGNSLQAAYVDYNLFFSNLFYGIKLENENLNYLITSIINSDLLNYYMNQKFRNRLKSNFTNINVEDIKKIPIPKYLDEDLVEQISEITKDLTDKKYEYTTDVANNLNELIFDLYDLSYWEKQRIRDYFLQKPKGKVTNNIKVTYKTAIKNSLQIYFEQPLTVEFNKSEGFNLIVAKITLGNSSNEPTEDKMQKYFLDKVFEQNPAENFLAFNEKIFGKDCVYIIKKDEKIKWTATKAFEDGQAILKTILTHE